MAERYTRLYSLERDLYIPGMPLIIAAGALLQDSITNNMLAQLKFKNIDPRTITAVKVSVTMYDAVGQPLARPVEHQYLDLNEARDTEFGTKAAIVLPSRNVRSFDVRLLEVVFADGDSWIDDGGELMPLIQQETLAEAFGDNETAHQYQIRYGSACKYNPAEHMDLWFCTCGCVNHMDETHCHSCRRVYTAFKEINIGALRLECADRLKSEQEQAVIDQAENAEKAKKWKKIAIITLPLLIAAIVILATVPGMMRNSRAYVRASALLSSNQFAQAAEEFAALGNYKDSLEQAEKNVPYQQALYVMGRADYNDADALSLVGKSKSDVTEGSSPAILLYEAAAEQFMAQLKEHGFLE